MSGNNDPQDREFEQATFRLNQSLKSCHSMISGYRALLAQEQDNQPRFDVAPSNEDEASDISNEG